MAGLDEQQYKEVQEGLTKIDYLTTAFAQLKEKYLDLKEEQKENKELAKAFHRLEIAILGNGTKGLKDRVGDLEKKPPRFSWKQVGAIFAIVLTVGGLMEGSFFYTLTGLSSQVSRIDSKLDDHIKTP